MDKTKMTIDEFEIWLFLVGFTEAETSAKGGKRFRSSCKKMSIYLYRKPELKVSMYMDTMQSKRRSTQPQFELYKKDIEEELMK